MKFRRFLLLTLCMSAYSSLSALRKTSPFRSQRGAVERIIENRPNSKSSLRYFTTTPDRSCIVRSRVTAPQASQSFIPKRELSIGQIGTGLWKKAQWYLTSCEDKKAELFDALASNIHNRNDDHSLTSIINLFKSEGLLEKQKEEGSLTPLEFAIQKSRSSDTDYQKVLIQNFISQKLPIKYKQLLFALKNYNIGAVEVLLDKVDHNNRLRFFWKVEEELNNETTTLDNIIAALNSNVSAESNESKILLEAMSKTYSKISKLKKILNLKNKFGEHSLPSLNQFLVKEIELK